jgi:hypothetical protein
MLASTEEKALLRYLYLREKSPLFKGNPQDIVEIMSELREIDKEDHYVYGFCLYGHVGEDYVDWDMACTLGTLEELHLATVSKDWLQVELTTLGRLFGVELHFCEQLEEKLKDRLKLEDNQQETSEKEDLS